MKACPVGYGCSQEHPQLTQHFFHLNTILNLWMANDISVELFEMRILRKLLKAYSAGKYALCIFPFLIIPAWNVHVMAGPQAAVLDHETILHMEPAQRCVLVLSLGPYLLQNDCIPTSSI